MQQEPSFGALALALGLGLLVGLQRERAGSARAGSRTVPLIALLGAICAMLVPAVGGWIVAAGLLGVTAAIVGASLRDERPADQRTGLASEVSMLVMYGIGALCVLATWELAVVLGGAVLLLLHFKQPLHALAKRIGEEDAHAVARFALLSMVILPVLPDVDMGPYGALNPHRTWLVVVLVVGIGLLAHVAHSTLGLRAGTLVGGLAGGLVSSTATTAAMARSVRTGSQSGSAALVVLIASAMVVPRQIAELAVLAPAALPGLLLPLLLVLAAFLPGILFLWRRMDARAAPHATTNPAGLRPALVFGALFALVSLAAAAATDRVGVPAVYAVAALSGLVELDAITISTGSMVADGRLDGLTGVRAILVAFGCNLVAKGVLAWGLGGSAIGRPVLFWFLPPLAAVAALVAGAAP
ncbi:MAG: hypothetical protein RIT25_2681 [Planctomycetota bacterium]